MKFLHSMLSIMFMSVFCFMPTDVFCARQQQCELKWALVEDVKDEEEFESTNEVPYIKMGNKIVYVHPDRPCMPLPQGLFFWQSREERVALPWNPERPVFEVKNGTVDNVSWIWDAARDNYMRLITDKTTNYTKVIPYTVMPDAPIHPSLGVQRMFEKEAAENLSAHLPYNKNPKATSAPGTPCRSEDEAD